ncbi:MAG: hypothetical protein UY48_C0053G0009 [Candidatus Gottesmanbacteria bacterium GW2011_GWB1_49_7]|uniref:Uncharacterized protein n=1 Tax=Candidatus Gottesmanbacteria bacterium GW2011_GWB1_49_7 TaxID=1618448 RepID=A0A0G1Y4J8_9BACT|nr:MAG: hypothetical protein UY48_C0053G0009 [Candidatus Gottesmanbacteria bacterium GW2011_GWB1_49_7]
MVRNAVAHNTETWDEVWDLLDALEIGAVMDEEHEDAMWIRLRKRLEDCEADSAGLTFEPEELLEQPEATD